MNFNDYVKPVDSLIFKNFTNINMQDLIGFLQKNSNITRLNLINNEIGDEGLKALANSEYLSRNMTQRSLADFNETL